MKTGIVLEIENNKAIVMQAGGSFVSVGAKAGWNRGDVVALPKSRVSVKSLYTVAACFVLALIFSISGFRLYFKEITLISLDINPSIEMGINRFDRVIRVSGYNEDGQVVINTVSLKHKSYKDAIGVILMSKSLAPYYTDDDVWIKIAVYSEVPEKNDIISASLINEVELHAARNLPLRVDCGIVSNELVKKAHEYNLTPGKYAEILELKELAPETDIEEYRDVSINKIIEIIDQITDETMYNDLENETESGMESESGEEGEPGVADDYDIEGEIAEESASFVLGGIDSTDEADGTDEADRTEENVGADKTDGADEAGTTIESTVIDEDGEVAGTGETDESNGADESIGTDESGSREGIDKTSETVTLEAPSKSDEHSVTSDAVKTEEITEPGGIDISTATTESTDVKEPAATDGPAETDESVDKGDNTTKNNNGNNGANDNSSKNNSGNNKDNNNSANGNSPSNNSSGNANNNGAGSNVNSGNNSNSNSNKGGNNGANGDSPSNNSSGNANSKGNSKNNKNSNNSANGDSPSNNSSGNSNSKGSSNSNSNSNSKNKK